ncbi:MAG: hypothetical protein K1X74_11135 [Pirellulales bacterium]|nr:hypothetical protein [Pirellulales bacterium]
MSKRAPETSRLPTRPLPRALTSLPPWLGLLLLGAGVLAVFGRATTFGFLSWDDGLHVTQNPGLRPVSWATWAAYWRAPYAGLYIPATYTAYAGLAWLCQGPWSTVPGGTQLSPAVFHAANLLVHLLNVGVVFLLARRLLAQNAVAALFAAGIFAWHPLAVESVVWVSELKGLLCGFFALAALAALVRSTPSEPGLESDPGQSWTSGWLVVASLCFLFAMLAKPIAASWPISAALLTWSFGRRLGRPQLLALAGWLAVVVALTWLTKSQQANADIEYVAPLVDRLPLAAHALSHYVVKLFLPVGLVADYGYSPIWVAGQNWLPAFWLIGAAFVALFGLGLWRFGKRPGTNGWRIAWGASMAMLFTLLPVSGLVPFDFQDISTVADRYAYLALVGPALAAGWCVARWPRPAVRGSAAAILVVLAVLSAQQVGHWRDDRTLWTHNLAIRPQSYVALRGLGAWHAAHGEIGAALSYYDQSFAGKPDANVANNVAWIRATHPDARWRNGQLALQLARAITVPPRDQDPALLDTLAAALAECGQYAEAAAVAERAAGLARKQGQEELARTLDGRAAVFRQSRPWRDAPTYSLPGTS